MLVVSGGRYAPGAMQTADHAGIGSAPEVLCAAGGLGGTPSSGGDSLSARAPHALTLCQRHGRKKE